MVECMVIGNQVMKNKNNTGSVIAESVYATI